MLVLSQFFFFFFFFTTCSMADVLTGCLLLHALFESLYQRFDDQVDADLIDGFDVVRVAIAQCHFHSLQERVPDFLKKKKKKKIQQCQYQSYFQPDISRDDWLHNESVAVNRIGTIWTVEQFSNICRLIRFGIVGLKCWFKLSRAC